MKIAKPRRLAREKELKERKQKQKQEKFMKKLESTGQVKRISGEEAMLQRFEQRIKERKDEIVKNTTKEFNLPYNEYRTMIGAFIDHFKQLDKLGKHPEFA